MVCYFQIIQVRLFSNDWLQLTVARVYSQINWVGVCGPLPKILTLFKTKLCDFPYLIHDLAKNEIPYL